MKKTAIRLREMGLPMSGTKAAVSTFRPSSSGRLQPLANGVERGQGGRQLALGLGQHLGPGDGEDKRLLVLAQADRLLLAPAGLLPVTRLLGPAQQPQRLLLQPFGGNRVKDDAQFAGPDGADALAAADHFGGQGRADDARQPLRAAPAGEEPHLDLGKADVGFRVGAGDPEVKAQGHLQPAAHAGALDGRHGGIGQGFKAGDDFEAALGNLPGLFRSDLAAAQLFEVGAGDEHARLAAAQDEAAQVGPATQLPENGLELRQHRLAQGVGPAARLVERDDGDVPVLDFQPQGGGLRWRTHGDGLLGGAWVGTCRPAGGAAGRARSGMRRKGNSTPQGLVYSMPFWEQGGDGNKKARGAGKAGTPGPVGSNVKVEGRHRSFIYGPRWPVPPRGTG
jgi:hypothetical protein